MSGVAKGDTIAYSISVPGIGSGEVQSLPILTQIVPGQSGRPYPTADTYMDNVTATLSY